MLNSKDIFVFTKDRPESLKTTLDSIQQAPYAKYVVDDSVIQANQQHIYELCNSYNNCKYLGRVEFNQFTAQHHIDFPRFDFLLRAVGNADWNLGYSRNFALLYSKSLGSER